MKKFTALLFIVAIAILAGTVRADYQTSYTVTLSVGQPITNIIMLEHRDSSVSPIWAFSAAGGGTTTLTNPFRTPTPVQSSLLVGIVQGLATDADPLQKHVVLFMDDTAAALSSGIAWGTLFPSTLEDQLIADIELATSGQDWSIIQPGLDAVNVFVNGDAQYGILGPEGPATAWFATGGTFTVMTWSDGTVIGAGRSDIAIVEDAATQFSATNNPNGAWSYGWTDALGGAFTLDTDAQNTDGLDFWRGDVELAFGTPFVCHNATAGDITFGAGTATLPAGQIAVHPGPNGEDAIVRFTAPSDGTYEISAAFAGADFVGPTTTDVHLLVNGVSFFDGNVDTFGSGPSYATTLPLAAGDMIDFAVGYGGNGDYQFDTTSLGAQVSALPGGGYGQIFVANFINDGNDTVGAYDLATGATVNAALFSGLDAPFAMAAYGRDLFVANDNIGTIGKYTTAGGTVNTALVTGLNGPVGLAVSGQDLFVVTNQDGTIGKYDATTGAAVNASLVTGLADPRGLAVSGPNLFVPDYSNGTVGVYDATTGATINASLVTGLVHPTSIAVSGGNLFVTNEGSGTIGVYDAATGATVNASLVTGLSNPDGIAVSGGNLFVANSGSGTIGVYDAGTGATVNASLVTGLSNPLAIAVVPPVAKGSIQVVGNISGIGSNAARQPGTLDLTVDVQNTDTVGTTYSVLIAGDFYDANDQVNLPIDGGQTLADGARATIDMDQPSGLYSGSITIHNDLNTNDPDEVVQLGFSIWDFAQLTDNSASPIDPAVNGTVSISNAPPLAHPGALRAAVRVTGAVVAGGGFAVQNLAVGNEVRAGQTLSGQVTFDPTGLPPGTYSGTLTVSLEAGSVDDQSNFSFLNFHPPVPDVVWNLSAMVRVAGDVDGDGHVDVVDLLYLVDAFGSVTGDANYDPRCDFNSDGSVDVVDLLDLVYNFGQY